MPIAAAPMNKKVTHTNTFDSQPLLNSPMISELAAILAISAISGTATTPFMTAVTIRALIGSMPKKLIERPSSVAMVMTL
jgi:hypothetical protein